MPDDGKIVIGHDDLSDPSVDDALAQQMSFGMATGSRDKVDDARTGLLYRPWFALSLAGALGAFLAWAILEPMFHDGISFRGNVTHVAPDEGPSLGATDRVRGIIEVSNTTVWLLAGRNAVKKDGQATDAHALSPGDVVEVTGEHVGNGIVLGNELVVIPGDTATYPPPDIQALNIRNTIVGFAIFPVIAAMVGLFIGAADGLLSRAHHRALVCGLVGFGCGLGLGLVADVLAQVIYAIGSSFVQSADRGGIGKMSTGAFLIQMMNRGLAWALAGAAMGLGQGIALRSQKLFVNGLLGGVAGALLGGLLFDPIDYLIKGGDLAAAGGAEVSRLVGFTIIGAATGFMIGVVELLAREAWCKMLTGPLAGKEFVLYRNPTVIGSSPKSEIFLFKDPEVEPQHALIHTVGEGYELEDKGGGAGTWINGRQVKRQRLNNGDQIRIGKTVLAFSVKEET